MSLVSLENWPILVVCAGMIAAAVIDWWKFKVPNKLTFPLILTGWALGLANTLGLGAGEGGIGSALAGTALGFGLLLPIYAVGGMGAGDVKMTMGFGAWVGAFKGMDEGMSIIFWAFLVGVLVGGAIGLVMILLRRRFDQNSQHVSEILRDLFSGAGLGAIAARANARRPRWHRLPYGVPLCIGFLGYLVYYYHFAG